MQVFCTNSADEDEDDDEDHNKRTLRLSDKATLELNGATKADNRGTTFLTYSYNPTSGIKCFEYCGRTLLDDRNYSTAATTKATLVTVYLFFVLVCLLTFSALQAEAVHEHLCLEDDYTNDLPIFIEKRTICNYDTIPVLVYSIKITPEKISTDYETKLCLKGEFAETFDITKEKELKLFGRLEQAETNLKLQIIRTANDIVGTPGERRQAINAIQFILIIEDCNQVSWQTIVVAILSSVCVALMSTLAIMLILYQQKGLIRTRNDDRPDDLPYPRAQFTDESFINPRRTSSYEFSTLSKHTETSLESRETRDL